MEKTIAIVGASGKMGSLICRALEGEYRLVKIRRGDDLNRARVAALVIDFGSGASSLLSAEFCSEHQIPLIIGSTGQSETEEMGIERCSKRTLIVKSGNFSVGIAMLKVLCAALAKRVGGKVVLIEKHHAGKKDAPSGTAKELCRLLQDEGVEDMDVLSVRAGEEVGTHGLDFYFGDEKLSLSHQAFSRQAFVCGVKIAVDYVLGQAMGTGMLSFDEIFMADKV